ncbi:glycosyltransferase [Niallia sp. Sow4_A1]|uniref:glycosyltransferase n=1 Tax=Niallia sp. Sow4_A1 TaxID=3438793 RepID=UPI003F94AC62
MKSKEEKIKVIFLDHSGTIGGGEKSLLDILRFINKEKYDPTLVCFEDGHLVERASKIEGVNVYVIPFSKKVLSFNRDVKSILQLLSVVHLIKPSVQLIRYIQKSNAQIIYTNSMKAHFVGILVGKMTFKKVIWHVRDILEDGFNKKLFVLLSTFTDEIICISNAVSNQFKKNKKVRIVYNGILPVKEVGTNEGI